MNERNHPWGLSHRHHDLHGHGHPHEPADHPGHFHERKLPLDRDFNQRAFTVGIGGPVGNGKTALRLQLCLRLRGRLNIAAVTNDIFTQEGRWRVPGEA